MINSESSRAGFYARRDVPTASTMCRVKSGLKFRFRRLSTKPCSMRSVSPVQAGVAACWRPRKHQTCGLRRHCSAVILDSITSQTPGEQVIHCCDQPSHVEGFSQYGGVLVQLLFDTAVHIRGRHDHREIGQHATDLAKAVRPTVLGKIHIHNRQSDFAAVRIQDGERFQAVASLSHMVATPAEHRSED